jgi:hypothetical protein
MAVQCVEMGGKDLYRNMWTKRFMAQVEYEQKSFRVGEIGLQYSAMRTSERDEASLEVVDTIGYSAAEFLSQASRGILLLGGYKHVRAGVFIKQNRLRKIGYTDDYSR